MDGLAAYIQEALKTDPFSGVIYVFRATERTFLVSGKRSLQT